MFNNFHPVDCFIYCLFILRIICRSCFAFSLASEHHRFHIKLRDSQDSMKSISDEFNIPLSALRKSKCIGAPKNPIKSDHLSFHDNHINNIKELVNDGEMDVFRLLRRTKSSFDIFNKIDMANEIKTNSSSKGSNENMQNKENEQPMHDNSNESSRSSTKVMSPNRNRVKMGTRVYSSRFLNKSQGEINNFLDEDFFPNTEAHSEQNNSDKMLSVLNICNSFPLGLQHHRNQSGKIECKYNNKCSTDDESQQGSSSKYCALSSDDQNENSPNDAYVISNLIKIHYS